MDIALRAESEFAAGIGCKRCRASGHFCQAHDYDEKNQPACKTCLTGELCGPMRARQRIPEYDGPQLPPAPPPLVQPAKRNLFPNALQKTAPVAPVAPKQAAAEPVVPCSYCGKPKHPGVCAARRAALTEKVEKAGVPPDKEARASQAETAPAIPSEVFEHGKAVQAFAEGMSGAVPILFLSEEVPVAELKARYPEPATSEQPVTFLERLEIARPRQPIQWYEADRSAGSTLESPSFEVVPRDRVPWRSGKLTRYAELMSRLDALAPGESLKMRFPSAASARSYAKNVTNQLKKRTPPVIYERHGDALFFDVQQPR